MGLSKIHIRNSQNGSNVKPWQINAIGQSLWPWLLQQKKIKLSLLFNVLLEGVVFPCCVFCIILVRRRCTRYIMCAHCTDALHARINDGINVHANSSKHCKTIKWNLLIEKKMHQIYHGRTLHRCSACQALMYARLHFLCITVHIGLVHRSGDCCAVQLTVDYCKEVQIAKWREVERILAPRLTPTLPNSCNGEVLKSCCK